MRLTQQSLILLPTAFNHAVEPPQLLLRFVAFLTVLYSVYLTLGLQPLDLGFQRG